MVQDQISSYQLLTNIVLNQIYMASAKDKVTEILARADIELNGSRPWDMQVHNENFYARAIAQGSLGVGESYMEGWWGGGGLPEFFARVTGGVGEIHCC